MAWTLLRDSFYSDFFPMFADADGVVRGPAGDGRVAAALGRPFTYVEETVDEAYAPRRRWSTESWQLEAWVSTYLAIGSGQLAEVSPDVGRVTGHAPRTLERSLS